MRNNDERGASQKINGLAFVFLSSVIFISVAYVVLNYENIVRVFLWDYTVYASATKTSFAGFNPYTPGVIQQYGANAGFNFTSPPIFLTLIQTLNRELGPRLLFGVYTSIFFLLLVYTGTLQLRLTSPAYKIKDLRGDIVTTFTAFNIAGITATMSGNFGVIMNSLVIISVYYGIHHNRWWLFYISLIAFATIKPFYLEFLLIPAFISRKWCQCAIISISCTVIVAGVYAFSWHSNPGLFADWRNSLADQSFARGDAGANLFAFFSSVEGLKNGAVVGVVGQILFVMGLLALVTSGLPKNNSRRLSAIWVCAVYANPRLMMYDVALAAIPISALIADWASEYFKISRFAAGAFCCAALFGLGLLSGIEPLIPASLAFPFIAMAAIALGCLDEKARTSVKTTKAKCMSMPE